MAGTINFAMTQQFDSQGRVLSGGQLYFFQAGTSTPQTAFKDVALTLPHPNPIVLDASGRVPMFYLADGSIKIRLATETGVTIIAEDQLLVVGPSSTTGSSGAVVDDARLLVTGDIKARYGEGTLTGYVRCNGNTIGKTGGSEATGDQCQALFEYLWQFGNITLNTSKGASANDDWNAIGKTLTLPDLRGRVIAGMNTMGATDIARLTAAGFGISGSVLGNVGSTETQALALGNLPPHVHTGSTDSDGSHVHTGGTTGDEIGTHTHSGTTEDQNASHAHDIAGGTPAITTSDPGDHLHHLFANDSSGTNLASATLQASRTGTAAGSPTQITQTTTAATLAESDSQGSHTHTLTGKTATQDTSHQHDYTTGEQEGAHQHGFSVPNTDSAHQHGFTTGALSGAVATPFGKVQPTMVLTFYIKL